jgi:penicillin-binding protein
MALPNKSQKTKKEKNEGSIVKTLRKYFRKIILAAVIVVVLAIGVLTGLVMSYIEDEPVRSATEISDRISTDSLTGFAYYSSRDENGSNELIGPLRADEDRRLITYEEMPKYYVDAVIAIEDDTFRKHKGVSLSATARAFFQRAFNMPVQTGGSTITQQLAKNTFLSSVKSNERKTREIFLALRIERIMEKEDIFAAYANKIYYGKAANLNNVYGIQAAAQGYFNREVGEINIAQAAYLAGIPNRPTEFSAFTNEGFNEAGYLKAKARQELVLSRMLKERYITKDEYNEAMAFDIAESFDYSLAESKPIVETPYLITEAELRAAEVMLKKDGITRATPDYNVLLGQMVFELQSGGYHIYTTIDKPLYDAMKDVVANPANFNKPISYDFKQRDGSILRIENAIEQVGATLIENKTGAILSFVGGRDFSVSQVNHSNFRSTSKRQTGSAIKPILQYGPALELGLIQPATPIDDIPLNYDDNWEPANWNLRYNGLITARQALNQSYNIPAVKVYDAVGWEQGYKYYSAMGLKASQTYFKDAELSAALGVVESSPEEMAGAFSTFANGGIYLEPYMIEKIVNRHGEVVYQQVQTPTLVFSEQTAYLMTDMLRTVISNGTGGGVRNHVPSNVDIAGKTGTTNDNKDTWFVGYSPTVTLGVWVGYSYPTTLPDFGRIGPQTWGRLFAQVLKTDPILAPSDAKFKVPSDIVSMTVSSTSGLLPSELSIESGYLTTDIFNKKYIPTEVDDSLVYARVVYYDGKRYYAKAETPNDMVQTGIFFKREEYELPDPTNPDWSGNKGYPVDFDRELPHYPDPRQITYLTPEQPSGLSIKDVDHKNNVSWDKIANPNIVGYRIYKYTDALGFGGGSFRQVGTVLQKDLTPERMSFEDGAGGRALYYVIAVDVGGAESMRSKIIGNMPNPFGDDADNTSGI